MKKTLAGVIILIVFSIVVILFYISSSSGVNKFMGEWRRIDKAGHNLVIKKEEDAILIFTGKYMVAAIYRENENILKTNLFSTATIITYIEKNDHILINKGRDGEYIRVTN